MKKQSKEAWENRLRDRLKDLEASPDDRLWAEIDQHIRPKRYRYAPLAAVLLLLLLSLSWFMVYDPDKGTVDRLTFTEEAMVEETESAGGTSASEQEHQLLKPDEDRFEKKTTSTESHLSQKAKEISGNENNNNSRKERGVSGKESIATLGREGKKGGEGKADEAIAGKESKDRKPVEMAGATASPFKEKNQLEEKQENKKIAGKTPDFSIPEVSDLEAPVLILASEPAKEKEIVKPKKKDSGIEIWSTLNPMLTYRKVTPNLEDNIRILALENTSPFSLDRIGLQTSVGLSYFISERLAIKGGAFFRFTQNKWSYSYFPATPDSVMLIPLEGGMVDVEPVFTEQVQSFVDRNMDMGVLMGIRYSAGSSYRRNFNLEFQATKDPQLRKILYYLAFELDVEKRLGEQFYLYAGPSFIWGLNDNSVANDQTFELKPYSLGLKVGVSYRFRPVF